METINLEGIRPEIQAGIVWLNYEGPENWWDKVNLIYLDIASQRNCVLGQLSTTGWYSDGITEFGISFETARSLGFSCVNTPCDCDKLTAEWKQVIKMIRGEE